MLSPTALPDSLDLAVEGDGREVARELAARLNGRVREYESFGTATIWTGRIPLDLATTRREVYDEPGALPRVEPAPLAEDLGRRDFTGRPIMPGLDVIIAVAAGVAVIFGLRMLPVTGPLLKDLHRARVEAVMERLGPRSPPPEQQP